MEHVFKNECHNGHRNITLHLTAVEEDGSEIIVSMAQRTHIYRMQQTIALIDKNTTVVRKRKLCNIY